MPLIKNKANALAFIWLCLLALLIALAASQAKKFAPDSDILSLLPKTEQDPLVKRAQANIDQQWAGITLWLANGKTQEQAVEQATFIEDKLKDSGLFAEVNLRFQPQITAEDYQRLFAARYHLLSPSDKAAIEHDAQQFIQQRLQLLYTPVGMQYAQSLEQDPLFIFAPYFNQLIQQDSMDWQDGMAVLKHDDGVYVLLTAKVAQLNFEQYVQLAQLHYELSEQGAIAAGMPLYAAYGTQSAEHEISTVGLWSMLGVIVLVLGCFRSLSPLVLALSSIAVGIVAAISFCLLFFGQIHLITLAFGSSLIGITIDYTFHYLCDRLREDKGTSLDSLKAVLPGIGLGVTSSTIAYGALLLTPFPALREIGLFTVSGLLAAWLTVVLLYPRAIQNARLPIRVPFEKPLLWYLYGWPALILRYNKVVWLLLGLFIALGLSQLKSDDDIRSMQKPADIIAKQEAQVKAIGQRQQDSQFFIISAPSEEQLLQFEGQWLIQLEDLRQRGVLDGYTALSQYLPSQQQQQQNWQLIKQQLFDSGVLAADLQQLGIKPASLDKIQQDFIANEARSIGINDWLNAVPMQWQGLFLGCEQTCSSVVQLSGIKGPEAIQALREIAGEQVIFVDLVGDLSAILGTYRYVAIGFLMLGFILISVFLALLLDVKQALTIVAVPFVALLASLASLALLGYAVSMFHIFGLLLALGIGMDYAIFHNVGKHALTVALAVSCSLMTSLLAFGLLALSSTALIQAFGMSLALGIFYAFLLAPLFKTAKNK